MSAMIATPKPSPRDLSPALLAKLTATAKARGCAAMMINLAPAPGCDISVLWSEVAHESR